MSSKEVPASTANYVVLEDDFPSNAEIADNDEEAPGCSGQWLEQVLELGEMEERKESKLRWCLFFVFTIILAFNLLLCKCSGDGSSVPATESDSGTGMAVVVSSAMHDAGLTGKPVGALFRSSPTVTRFSERALESHPYFRTLRGSTEEAEHPYLPIFGRYHVPIRASGEGRGNEDNGVHPREFPSDEQEEGKAGDDFDGVQ
jgi:hypothetical protein